MNWQRGQQNEDNISTAWAVFRTVDSVHSPGTWDYHLGRSEAEKMKELELICKTCIHRTVCGCLAHTVRVIDNINVDVKSGNYPGNVVLHISCTDYIEEDDRTKRSKMLKKNELNSLYGKINSDVMGDPDE